MSEHTRQSAPSSAEQAQRDPHVVRRLDQCRDILTLDEVIDYFGFSRRTYYRRARHGKVPAPIPSLLPLIRFHRDTIAAFIRQQPQLTRRRA